MQHSNNGTSRECPILPNNSAAKLAQQALRENEVSLAVTLDSIADGVISTDSDGHILRMNRVAQQLTGWTLIEGKGRKLCDVFRIVNSAGGAVLASPFELAMNSNTAVALAPNTTLLARDGKCYVIEDSAARIRDHENSASLGVVLVFRDVTDKSNLEIEFQKAKKLETIGRLAGGIAHDFNNMLGGIIGYSEMLLEHLKGNSLLHGYTLAILETSERAAKLTSQLLAFSRKGGVISQPVNMHAIILSVVALLKSSSDKRISFITQLNSPATVLGDPTLIESALLNLGLNARDAISLGGVVRIAVGTARLKHSTIKAESLEVEPGEYVEITVSDTGTGMSDNVKGHLYEPYFTTKEFGHGTGLGLAAVYGTLKEHRGAITVKSVVGQGTSFKLYFPSCELPAVEEKEPVQLVPGSGCILLVDDEKIVRETASAMIRTLGFEVLLAENGLEAVNIYRRESARVRLVILDVVMPHLSGPDTFFALKNINRDIRVVFSSGYPFENGARELLGSGVFGFIQKPFRKVGLYGAIQKALLSGQRLEEGSAAAL